MVHATINPSSLSTEKLTGTAKNHNKKQQTNQQKLQRTRMNT